MRRITSVVLAATVLAATAAMASTTKSFYDKSYNFGSVRSFSVPQQERISTDPLADNAIWDNLIRGSLQGSLQTYGFEHRDEGADVLVSFSVKLEERYDVRFVDYGYPYGWGPWGRDWFMGWGYGWGAGYGDAWIVPYTESTLVVDITDAKTNRLVWRGLNIDDIDLDDVDDDLPDAVDDVLKRFVRDARLGEDS